MHLTRISAATPADVPVASVPFRGDQLDIYRFTVRDAFEVANRAAGILAIWGDNEECKIERLISEIGRVGLDSLHCVLCAGLRASRDEVEAADLGFNESVELLLLILDHGIPEEPLGKLLGELGKMSSRLAKLTG